MHSSNQMLDSLRADPKTCRQFLLLVHLYSRTDVSALAKLRGKLVKPKFTAAQVWFDPILGGNCLPNFLSHGVATPTCIPTSPHM